jgi:hypothetical protein
MKWVKILFFYEIFMLLWWEFLLNGNHITKLYAVIVWENVVLSYCDLCCEAGNFLSSIVITGYHFIVLNVNCAIFDGYWK